MKARDAALGSASALKRLAGHEQVSTKCHRATDQGVSRLPRHEVAAVAQQERADVIGEHRGRHAIEGRIDDVVAGAEQDQRARALVAPDHRGSLRAVAVNALS